MNAIAEKPQTPKEREQQLIAQEKARKSMKRENPEDQIAPGSDIYNLHTSRRHLANEIAWSAANWDTLMKGLSTGRVKDISQVPKVRNEPILIIGSGPTLDDALPILKDWEGDILTSTSQASTCVKYGKDPKYVLALDPDSHPDEMKIDSWEGRDTTLIMHPGIEPKLTNEHIHTLNGHQVVRKINPQQWKGKIGLFRKLEPQTAFYNNAQKIEYSIIDRIIGDQELTMKVHSQINTQIVMLGCAANAQLFVATLLGYSPIYLVGVDFGYPYGRSRFSKWNQIDGKWIEDPAIPLKDYTKPDNPPIETDSGVLSHEIHMFYKRNFMSAWRLELSQIINTGKNTLIETPYAPIETVIKQQGIMGGDVRGFNKKQIIETTEKYLARQKTIVIKYKNSGIQFIEFSEGMHEVLPYLDKVQKMNDTLDYNGTIRAIKKLVPHNIFNEKDKAEIESWKYQDDKEAVEVAKKHED